MPLRSSISPTGCRPLARRDRPAAAHRRGRARSAAGSRRKARARCVRSSENCHHRPSMRATRPSLSIALRSFWTDDSHLGGCRFAVAHAREAEEIARKLRAVRLQNEGPAHAKGSAEKTGLEDDVVSRRSLTGSLGVRCGRAVGRPVVAREHEVAKSTSCASSRSRSSVVVPGLKDVVQGSTRAMSSRPRVSACSSFCCFPEEPRKMRGLSMRPPENPSGTLA